MHGAGIGAGAGGGLAVTEGKAGHGFTRCACSSSMDALCAEPVGVNQIGRATVVGGEVAACGIDLAAVRCASRAELNIN